MPESITIFKDQKAGTFLLQKTCLDPVLKGPISCGEPELLMEEELRTTGLAKIVRALSNSSQPCSETDLTRRAPTEEDYAKFRRRHQCVSLTRWSNKGGDIEVRSLRRVRGGYRSIPGSTIVVGSKDPDKRLIDAIFEAFELIESES